ncbi:hypothetical protein SH580_16960 [Coraliomargarita algicola]|uniref:Uncharacterized protein n=1 Tax=Coraliomargarita algicola TaxID=3092156 RepID=A0ABZ0RGG6_9BACT|nr:hypothetical protein [Coraliomargarita sp. J2-16]WPJ95117.1 hypothetical protein SH580_16960 [Coraliomargarita sp. J2-16]
MQLNEDEDFKLISQPTDFLGLNVYTGKFARANDEAAFEILPMPPPTQLRTRNG